MNDIDSQRIADDFGRDDLWEDRDPYESDFEEFNRSYSERFKKKKITCSFCKKKNLFWVATKEGFKPINKKGAFHDCKNKVNKKEIDNMLRRIDI